MSDSELRLLWEKLWDNISNDKEKSRYFFPNKDNWYKKLDYFSTECKYSPNAYRGNVRELIKNLEKIRPSSIIDIIHSGEQIVVNMKTIK